jgi:hypothetical protein
MSYYQIPNPVAAEDVLGYKTNEISEDKEVKFLSIATTSTYKEKESVSFQAQK